MTRLSLIIPTFNEADNILILIEKVESQMGSISYEIIVVDDDSPDGTASRVETYAKPHPNVRLVKRVGKRGLSRAVLEGMSHAQGEIFAVMDADLSHDERLLPQFVQAIDEGADMVIGSRRIPGGGADHWPWYRRFTSSLGTWVTIHVLGLSLSDPMSGFFAIQRSIYERCKDRLRPQGYKILLELYCQGKPSQIREIPYVFKDRKQGYSKLTPSVIYQLFKSLIYLKRTARGNAD